MLNAPSASKNCIHHVGRGERVAKIDQRVCTRE